MLNRFFEIKNGNFVASEKNKVNNVNLKIEKKGEIVSLLGPSGVGKTTITIKINHGGHSDFVSLPFEIHVTADGPGEEHGHEDE